MGAYATAGGGVMYTQIIRKDKKTKCEDKSSVSRRQSHYKKVTHNLYHGQLNKLDKGTVTDQEDNNL